MSPKAVRKQGKATTLIAQKIHQSYFVVALCIGVLLGAILTLVFRVNFFSSAVWLVVVAVIIIVAYFSPRMFLLPLALAAGLLLIFYRGSLELAGEDYIRQFYDQTVTVTGTIDGDPETDDGKTKFKLRDLAFGTNARTTPGNLYISLSGGKTSQELARGDRVTLEGKLTAGFGTYTGFMSRPTIVEWQRPSPGDPVLNVRNWFAARVQQLIPEPEHQLGLSYLLGMKTGLPNDLDQGLRTVGLVHIVVASGAHLSILVDLARKIFGKISRMTSVIFSLLSIGFFMALVGWTPSIMRAGIMSSLKTMAWRVGRSFAPWRIILLVAAITLLINPMFLINLGWLLSFASFSGIMLLGPALTKFFYGEKKPKFIASTILTTLSATLMTLPVTLYYFGTLSLISPLANLLILPTLPYAMGLVFLSGVVQGVPGLETAVSFVATKLLDFHIAVVDFFGQMKSFLIQIDINQPWVFALYLFLVPSIIVFLVRSIRKLRPSSRKICQNP